jgi:hypothetical protein
MDIEKAKGDENVLKSNRLPICGRTDFSVEVIEKIQRV